MTDATAKLLERFKDLKDWDHVEYNVPIFIEHELWEVPHPWKQGEKVHLAVLPGEDKPKEGTMLYSIGAKELLETTGKINGAMGVTGTPIGIYIGHRSQNKPEKDQPKLVGYGVGAKMGTFGPKGIKAILADKAFYEKGQYEEVKSYPHRSPEFKPLTGNLTGLAMLRNDPKLPMGMMTYQVDDVVCYGAGLMSDITVCYGTGMMEPPAKKKPKAKEGAGSQEQDGEEEEGGEEGDDTPTGIKAKGTQQDPTKPPTASEPDKAQHDAWCIHMEHFKRNDPMMLQMCKTYEAESAAAQTEEVEGVEGAKGEKPAIGEDGKPAPKEGEGKPKKPVKDEGENMAAEDATINYKALADAVNGQAATIKTLTEKVDQLATVNTGLTTKYAASEAARIEARLSSIKVIKDRKKLREKLAATDDAGRKVIFDDVIENYADIPVQDRDPSRTEQIEVYSEGMVEDEQADPVIDNMDMTAAVAYAEENKLDFEKDYEKICAAMATKNGRPKKAAAQ